MKTKEELNALKAEVEALNKKLAELTEEDLTRVVGGDGVKPFDTEKGFGFIPPDGGGRDVFVCDSNSDLCTAE